MFRNVRYYRLESLRRYRHRRQRAGADAVGTEYGADSADNALGLQLAQFLDERGLVNAEPSGDFGEGLGSQRNTLLKIIQQALLESRKLSHRPIR